MTEAVCNSPAKTIRTPGSIQSEGTYSAKSDGAGRVSIQFQPKKEPNGEIREVPFEKVYRSIQAYAKRLGLEIPSKDEVIRSASQECYDPKTKTVVGSIVITAQRPGSRASAGSQYGCDSYRASREPTQDELLKRQLDANSPSVGYHDPWGKGKSKRLESIETYLDKKSAKEVEKQKYQFAKRIFLALQAKGIIRKGITFDISRVRGILGSIVGAAAGVVTGGKAESMVRGKSEAEKIIEKIVDLIEDKDSDGHFDFDISKLTEILNNEKVLNGGAAQLDRIKTALSQITNHYFEDEGNSKAKRLISGIDAAQAPKGTTRVGRTKREEIGQMTINEFRHYIRNNYRGKLAGNPDLQQQFAKDLQKFLESHFTTAEATVLDDKGDPVKDARGNLVKTQIIPRKDFVFNPNNASKLARDSKGLWRVGCQQLAQATAIFLADAGCEVRYFGVKEKGEDMGHVVTVGYIRGKDGFMIGVDNFTTKSDPVSFRNQTAQDLLKDVVGRSRVETITEGTRYMSRVGQLLTAKVATLQGRATATKGT